MTIKPTALALSLGLFCLAAGAQMADLGPNLTGYQRFLVYPHLERGFTAMARKDRSVALAEFEQAYALASHSPVLALHLANAYRRFEEPARAEALLRQQLQRNPGHERLTSALAELRGAAARPVPVPVPVPVQSAVVLLPPLVAPVASAVLSESPPALAKSQADSGVAPLASAALAAGRASRTAPVRTPRKPLTATARRANAAYALADKAYKASAQGHHAGAADAARAALRLVPESLAYRSLLVYELSEIGAFEEADAVASAIPPRAIGSSDELLARQKLVRQHIAFQYFDQANQAKMAGREEEALQLSRTGVEYAPDVQAHRVQLVGLLLMSERWPEAAQAATDALNVSDAGPVLLVLRAYALQRQEQRPLAQADLDNALAAADLQASDRQNFRLIAVDAALTAGDPAKALELLEDSKKMPSGNAEAFAERRTLAFQAFRRGATAQGASPPAWPTPKVVCVGQDLSAWCELWPGEKAPDPGYASADAAYKSYGARNYDAAIAQAREAVQLSPGNLQYQMLLANALVAQGRLQEADRQASEFLAAYGNEGEMLALRSRVRERLGQKPLAAADAERALQTGSLSVAGEASMLLQLERKNEARERFQSALRDGELADQADTDTAYLAIQVGDDNEALAAFDRASGEQTLPNSALQDAAYAAGRLGRNVDSVGYFKRAIDANEAGELPLEPQEVFYARRSVADRTRKSGVYGSLTYRGLTTSGLALNPGATSSALQAGLEGYWRPLGYGDGRLLEVYGGVLGTLYSKDDSPAGASTVQGSLGARVKPLAQANLILALERRLAIGNKARTDWLVRAGYSWDKGLDLRVDKPSWVSAQIYAETGRFIKARQNYATFEGLAGRSVRLDALHPRLVAFPHVVFGADRNTGYEAGKQKAVGAGVGVNLRYWFNEDRYAAPRSYWDASLQYRGRISGDNRAKGFFFRLTLAY